MAEDHEQQPERPLMLDREDLAALLKVALATLDRMNELGQIPEPVRWAGGKCVRWSRYEIESWVHAGCPERREWKQQRSARLMPRRQK